MMRKALDAATAAALGAGRILREEFHRRGGARGEGDHAGIDRIAEIMIREHLAKEFPEWGYLGEETGAREFPAGNPYWAVDPNDGTTWYLRGMRGASVSIALIREGIPVLGVVYSHSCPDDRGDLFAWAEGSPVLRNGIPQAPLEDAPPGPHTVLLHSPSSRKNMGGNLLLGRPGRLRDVPSIAYRLALVAGGEGNLAVSLNGPTTWDVAGGHALLRGAGGDLWNERGELVRYGNRGLMPPGLFVFGGGRALAKHYFAKPWTEVLGGKKRPPDGPWIPLFPVQVPPGEHVSDPEVLSRAQGCLLGQVAGDSLGGLVEFLGGEEIVRRYPEGGPQELADGGTYDTIAGQPTDDSELAILLARAIVAERRYDEEAAARHYAWWHASDPFDEGVTTRTALDPAAKAPPGRIAEAARRAASAESQANGALMRAAPLGVFAWTMPPEDAAQLAMRDASLTHPNPVCLAANAAFVVAVAAAVRTGDRERAYGEALSWCRRRAVPEVTEALARAKEGPPEDFTTHRGWVLVALRNAFHHLLFARDPAEAVVETVRRGGDADTNAAISGALSGALFGRDAIPPQWRRMVQSCRPYGRLSTVRRPRPEPCWPVDVLELSECLLSAGETSRGQGDGG